MPLDQVQMAGFPQLRGIQDDNFGWLTRRVLCGLAAAAPCPHPQGALRAGQSAIELVEGLLLASTGSASGAAPIVSLAMVSGMFLVTLPTHANRQ